jgi:hypothetical protein
MYYIYLTAMVLTLVFTINYFIRIKTLEKEYSDTGNTTLSTSRRARLVDYIIDLLIIGGISFDKFYVLKQSIALRYVFVICFVAYYLFCEALYGRSLGKICTNTIVARTNHFSYRIIIRTLARMIPFEQLSFLSKKSQGWHDRISKTYLYVLK